MYLATKVGGPNGEMESIVGVIVGVNALGKPQKERRAKEASSSFDERRTGMDPYFLANGDLPEY